MSTIHFFLEDGRQAKQHISTDDHGNTVIEIFEEIKPELKLTKRIIQKKKEIVSEETIQTLSNGQIVEEQVKSLEPKVDLEVRQHIAYADSPSPNDPLNKENISEMVRNAVVEAISNMAEFEIEKEETKQRRYHEVEETKTKIVTPTNLAIVAAIVAQAIVIVWFFV